MADQRKGGIAWTDETWNPLRGCSRVSEGCRNCYAEAVAARFNGPGQPFEGLATRTPAGPRWTGKVELVAEHLEDPIRWRRSRRIFVNSVSDLFHENVPDEWIDRIFAVMAVAHQHTYQVLTKRAERMHAYLSDPGLFGRLEKLIGRTYEHDEWVWQPVWPLPHVWIGVTVEDQAAADKRIPLLLQVPAAVRFLSCEPLLGPINIRGHALGFAAGSVAQCQCGHGHGFTRCPNTGGVSNACHHRACTCAGFQRVPGVGIHWVIAGGESGPNARPMHPDLARALRDQCQDAGVAFFFKQWGEWAPGANFEEVIPASVSHDFDGTLQGDDAQVWRVGKRAAGRELDGRTWDEFPGGGG